MEKSVSAADANREFSRLLQLVRKGASFVVTSHGKPVARISPIDEHSHVAERARRVLFESLEAAPARKIGSWTREELYER